MLVNIVINIFCSLFASLLFLFVVLFFFKPSIKISPFLTQGPSPRAGEGIAYFVKIVNLSYFIAYDVRVEMHTLKKLPMPGDKVNLLLSKIPLVIDSLPMIAGYRSEKKSPEARHCVKFRTTMDLSTMLADDLTSIQVRVILRHGLTGLSNVHTQVYTHPSQVKLGNFTSGSTFDVLPPVPTKI
jgi:hypothetical protein